jgi:hypothetical protein
MNPVPKPIHDPQLTALRDEIRSAGASVRVQQIIVRVAIGISLAPSLVAMVLSGVGESLESRGLPAPTPAFEWALGLSGVALSALFTALFGIMARGADRRSRCDLLVRRLAGLSDAEQAAVLLPLRSDGSADTRRIAEGLIGKVRLPAELVPAAAPEGRGDEPGLPLQG